VAEADIGKVRVGQTVRFNVDAFPGRRFEGRVKQIRLSPIIQQNVVTYDVVVEVDNRDLALMPGMTAYISVQVDHRDDALLVPSAALRFRPKDAGANGKPGAGGKSDTAAADRTRATSGNGAGRAPGGRVYVVRGKELVGVQVQTGLTDGKQVEIVSGELKAGDRVAVQSKLADGPGGTGTPRMRAF
jgi:HlyD family secretion protein